MANSIDRHMIEVREREAETRQHIIWEILYPRIWKLMIICALPLLVTTEPAFERLEHTGTLGPSLAMPLFSSLLVGYGILVFVMKMRNL